MAFYVFKRLSREIFLFFIFWLAKINEISCTRFSPYTTSNGIIKKQFLVQNMYKYKFYLYTHKTKKVSCLKIKEKCLCVFAMNKYTPYRTFDVGTDYSKYNNRERERAVTKQRDSFAKNIK